jgi:hypothetical protein
MFFHKKAATAKRQKRQKKAAKRQIKKIFKMFFHKKAATAKRQKRQKKQQNGKLKKILLTSFKRVLLPIICMLKLKTNISCVSLQRNTGKKNIWKMEKI